jgi:hypothetical protein
MLAMSSSRKAPSREEETSATSCKGAGFAASFAKIGACTTASVPHLARRPWHCQVALYTGQHFAAWCGDHVAISNRNGWG